MKGIKIARAHRRTGICSFFGGEIVVKSKIKGSFCYETPLKFWVHLTGFKLNARLAKFLRDPKGERERLPQNKAELPSYRPTNWRIRDRLSKQDIKDLVEAFKGGTTTRDLAIRYGIDVRRVRKLLREEGVKRA